MDDPMGSYPEYDQDHRADTSPIPSSVIAEQSVLGAMFLSPECIDDVVEILTTQDFFSLQHRLIFSRTKEVFGNGIKPDIVAVGELLQSHNEMRYVGDMSYLAEVAQNTPSASNVKAYAEIVKDKAIERHILNVGMQMSSIVYGEADTNDKLRDVEALCNNLDLRDKHQERSASDIFTACIPEWDERSKREGGLIGFSTGYPLIDRRTYGLQGPNFWVLAAYSSQGKTTLALNITESVTIDQGIPTLFFSLEMSGEELMDKLLASTAEIPQDSIKRGNFFGNQSQFSAFNAAGEKIKAAPLFIDDRSNLTIDQIVSSSRRFKRKHKSKILIVVDYVQLVTGEGNNKEERISDVSKKLKQLGKELDCPVMAMVQTNRDAQKRQDKRPIPSDIRDSSAPHHDSDILIMFYERDDSTTEILFRKNRGGKQGTEYLERRFDISKFKSILTDDQREVVNSGQDLFDYEEYVE